jgi:hypothetical protein
MQRRHTLRGLSSETSNLPRPLVGFLWQTEKPRASAGFSGVPGDHANETSSCLAFVNHVPFNWFQTSVLSFAKMFSFRSFLLRAI